MEVGPARPEPPARRRGEKAILLAVLLVVGGALGYAAYVATMRGAGTQPPAGDVAWVSEGEPVDLAANAVKGKYTVYDFYADWCAPCRALDVHLRGLAARHPNVAIRKIDIVDWTTPVVAQHRIEGLPYMVLFDPDGKQIAAGIDVYVKLSELFEAELE